MISDMIFDSGMCNGDHYNDDDCVCVDESDPEDGFNYKQMMSRDERRFKMADKDGDLRADREEFTAFLHPEEYDYMQDIVVLVRPPHWLCTVGRG